MSANLSVEFLSAILDTLPADLNFIDDTDTIRYRREYQIFKPRPEVIGQKAQDCHTEALLPLVNQVIGDLRSGKRKVVEFWKDRNGRKIYILYFPVKDQAGRYLGILEDAQDVTDIRKLTGEKRGLEEG